MNTDIKITRLSIPMLMDAPKHDPKLALTGDALVKLVSSLKNPIPMPTFSERDWNNDFGHENGNYVNLCCHCREAFFGHKRRVVCKICDTFAKNFVGPIKPPSKEELEAIFKEFNLKGKS